MATKKSLKSLNQINGRDETKTPKFKPTKLEKLWDDDVRGYNTTDTEEYERYINEDLNSAELRQHAVEVAHVAPSTSIERTKNRLILEHKKYVAGMTKEDIKPIKDKPVPKELLKFMAETK
jgi:hypothetical protein